jgi:Methylamine utilisation protein MauE
MDPILILIACALMAWLFAGAAWGKFQSPLRMKGIIDNYQVLPFKVSTRFVIILASIELLIALAVLLPVSRQWGALMAAVLLVGYGGAVAVNLLRGRTDFDCGCSGPAARHSLGSVGTPLLWRNTALVLVAGLAMAPLAARPLQWIDYVVVMLAAAFFILMYQVVENLLANHQQLIKL